MARLNGMSQNTTCKLVVDLLIVLVTGWAFLDKAHSPLVFLLIQFGNSPIATFYGVAVLGLATALIYRVHRGEWSMPEWTHSDNEEQG